MSTNVRRFGKYELHERLGQGGMAEVWKALDPQLRRFVAIKFLHANMQTDSHILNRFSGEAQVIASLRHPNIIHIHEFAVAQPDSDNPTPYMVMDYIEGQTLKNYIDKTSAVGNYPSAHQIVDLFTSISLAIDYAHQHKVIHRDIKPANILLDSHNTTRNSMGEPILTDFGLFKMLGSAAGTLTSMVTGTPYYLAPEQAIGRAIDDRTDIYPLGIMLYEIFTGSPPFKGNGMDAYVVIHQHIYDTPTSPELINPEVPPAVSAVILRCLAKNPDERFPTAAALTAALAEALKVPVPREVAQARALDTANSPTFVGTVDDATVRASAAQDLPTVRASTNNIPAPNTSVPPSSIAVPPPAQSTRVDTAPSSVTPTSPPIVTVPGQPQRRNRLFIGLAALLLVVLIGAGLGAFFLTHTNGPATATGVGSANFISSGNGQGQNNQGINDEFQVSLTKIPSPASGKSYFAWLLPDNIQGEGSSLRLGQLNFNNGALSMSAPYVDPQHNNLLVQFSHFLITEENTNPAPQNYTLDKTMWRYFATIPQQTPNNCTNSLTQLSYLCHLRHLLSGDPELANVHLQGGLNFWFGNNVSEVLKWSQEAVDHTNGFDIRHKVMDILYTLDGPSCFQQDVQKASPNGNNTTDDANIAHFAAVSLLDCSLTPTKPGFLSHIHNHLNTMINSPGASSSQVKLGTQIASELNTDITELKNVQQYALRLAAMDDTQLEQQQGKDTRSAMNKLVGIVISGGTDPATGNAVVGTAQISSQIQQLSTFQVTKYTGQ